MALQKKFRPNTLKETNGITISCFFLYDSLWCIVWFACQVNPGKEISINLWKCSNVNTLSYLHSIPKQSNIPKYMWTLLSSECPKRIGEDPQMIFCLSQRQFHFSLASRYSPLLHKAVFPLIPVFSKTLAFCLLFKEMRDSMDDPQLSLFC